MGKDKKSTLRYMLDNKIEDALAEKRRVKLNDMTFRENPGTPGEVSPMDDIPRAAFNRAYNQGAPDAGALSPMQELPSTAFNKKPTVREQFGKARDNAQLAQIRKNLVRDENGLWGLAKPKQPEQEPDFLDELFDYLK